MPTYLVTGAAGFIGSNLVEQLLAAGHTVRGLDSFLTGKSENLDAAVSDPTRERFTFLEGDIRSAEDATAAMAGVDYVLHQAALPSVPRSVDDPMQSHDVNVNGTLNLLNVARATGVKRFVYAASSSAYGDSETLPKVEDMVPNPLSPYAVNKLAGEYYCRVYTTIFGVPSVGLRYFNVFGPRQDPTSQYAAVIPKFITALLSGEKPTVYGDGEQSRDFTYIDNVVQANVLACESERAPGHVVNVACGDRFTLNQLLGEIADLLGVPADATYVDSRAGDVKHSLADISAARDLLGYEPGVSFRDGLRRTVDFFKDAACRSKS